MTQANPTTSTDTEELGEPITLAPQWHVGRWVSGIIALLVVLGIATLLARGSVDWSATREYLFDSRILEGVLYTVYYAVLAMIFGIIGGVILAVMKMSRNPVFKVISGLYIWLFRGLPLLILLLILYNFSIFIPSIEFTIPLIDFELSIQTNSVLSPFGAAVAGLTLNESAYMAEVVRAGLSAVSRGQTEAALSLGMRSRKTLRWVILPQAMRVIVPPTANQFVAMLKNTSLVVVIAGHDLMTVAKSIYSNNFLTMELLFVAAAWYLVLVTLATIASSYLERRFSQGQSVRAGPSAHRWLSVFRVGHR